MDAGAGHDRQVSSKMRSDAAALARVAEKIAFNQALGLRTTVAEQGHIEVILPSSDLVTNTYGTVHAVAVPGPAEMAAGMAVVSALGASAIGSAVARSMNVRYRKPARGELTADARIEAEVAADLRAELLAEGRLVTTVLVFVRDFEGDTVAEVAVEWVVKARQTAGAAETNAGTTTQGAQR